MKKIAAGVAAAAALSLTFAGAANASYGHAPSAGQVKHDIRHAIAPQGKINAKRANHLKREVRLAKKAGLLTGHQAAALIKKINHDTKGKHHR